MNILFFSHIYKENGFSKHLTAIRKKLPGIAVSNYEKGFLNSLNMIDEATIVQINREFFPYYKSIKLESPSKEDLSNINLCSHKYQDKFFFALIKKDKETIDAIKKADFIVFSTYHDWRLFKYVKKINKNVRTILLLPDLPNLLINHSSLKHKIGRKLMSINFFKSCKHIDGLIPITDHLGEYMKKYIKTYLTIEGVVKKEDINAQNRINYKNSIVYSGGLARHYGIIDLIKAYQNADLSKKYKLIICGKGECENKVIQYSKNNDSIQYLGFIPRNDVLKLLPNSAFLILPENPNNSYAKYSFHSKIIEYLASGTPIIGYMYPGIPKEYDSHILKIDGDGKDVENELINVLIKYTSMSQKDNIEFGERAKDFIINRISENAVAKKIKDFINMLK